jgi:hypothetical protein
VVKARASSGPTCSGTGSYLDWLEEAGLVAQWDRFIPEGESGHSLILARVT